MKRLLMLLVVWPTIANCEDWANPTTTSNYTNVISDLKARDVSCAKMDYSSATNLPTGVIRWNGTSKKFESWNGATWSDIYPEIAAHLASTSNPHSTTAAQVGAPTTSDFTSHTGNTSNPHSTTAAQAGALAVSSNLSDLGNVATARSNLAVPSTTDLSNHTGNTSNPHLVTTTQIGALLYSNNLSDLLNKTTARSNISAAKSGSNGDITEMTAIGSMTNTGNITIQSNSVGAWIKLCGGGAAFGCWKADYDGKLVPPTALQTDYTPWPSGSGGYTVRRSLNPAVATAQQCADAVNTLWADMIAQGLLK